MPLNICYEDNDMLVCNKPSGLLSIPDRINKNLPSMQMLLKQKYEDIYVVHRLDKETSGCIVFAKNKETHQYLSSQFEHRKVQKIYHAILQGTPALVEGTIAQSIVAHKSVAGKMTIDNKKGKTAISHYKLLEKFGKYSLVSFHIETGRTHQIRVHSAFIGHPIICDALYGNGEPVFIHDIKKMGVQHFAERPLVKRIALHAYSLHLENSKGEAINVSAMYEKDMNAMLIQCRKWLKH